MNVHLCKEKNRVRELPQRIGLCLSGGGFRAAAFHLGVLMYLERVGLLNRVCLLSTVSGGTFTGAKYAISRLDQIPAEIFFKAYWQELRDSQIFPKALEILTDGKKLKNASGRKDIVTCAAQSYCETLFCHQEEPIMFGELLNGNTSPLEEIIFNATDFRTGLAFRFQRSSTGLIGNLKTNIKPADAAQIRVGDIVAASSCFPGGFEPIEFPGDFTWGNEIPSGVADAFLAPSPLMDGGVYDNQGLESLLLSAKRTGGVDLILMSDADRQSDPLYEMPEPISPKGLGNASLLWKITAWWNPSLGMLDCLLVLLLIACALSVVAVGVDFWLQLAGSERISWLAVLFKNIVPLLTTAGTALLIAVLRSLFRNKLLSKVPQLQSEGWKHLRKVRLLSAAQMIILRVSSLVALTSSVFMKHIRAAGYRNIYEDPDYADKLAANYIYTIRSTAPWAFVDPVNDSKMLGTSTSLISELETIPEPSRCVFSVAEAAARVPTLLWFQNDQQLQDLVAAGQIATCLNLLKFIARTREFDEGIGQFASADVARLWIQMKEHWEQFQRNPYAAK
jgi:predicted acylesterase/phospholipase RssA